MNNKPLSKKDRLSIIRAWTDAHILCAYFDDKESGNGGFTNLFDPHKKIKGIYKLLDSVVTDFNDEEMEKIQDFFVKDENNLLK